MEIHSKKKPFGISGRHTCTLTLDSPSPSIADIPSRIYTKLGPPLKTQLFPFIWSPLCFSASILTAAKGRKKESSLNFVATAACVMLRQSLSKHSKLHNLKPHNEFCYLCVTLLKQNFCHRFPRASVSVIWNRFGSDNDYFWCKLFTG